MAYIPKDAKWYIAEIIQEFKIEDELESVVHINFILVRADSPEEAYEKAIELGKSAVITYQNTDNKTVTIVFRGLHNLNVIHDELKHGAEIIYEKMEDMTEGQIKKLICPKEKLGIFRPEISQDE